MPELANYGALCTCNFTKNTAYSVIFSHPRATLHGYLVIELEYEMANMLVLPSFSGLFCLFFFLLFAFANFWDSRDSRKVIDFNAELPTVLKQFVVF